jgi:DNA-binding SARP family transcriptional activator
MTRASLPMSEAPVQRLRVRLLGGFELRLGEATLPLDSRRAEALLAYLLLHRDSPQGRQHLAFLLWPDSSEPQARTNLRHLLHTLRHAVPQLDACLEVTATTIRWRPEAAPWLDVAAFEEAVQRAERLDAAESVHALREAADAYSGDLLPGRFEEWLLDERERLRHAYTAALERLAAGLEARGEHLLGIAYAERLIAADPLREEAYQLLMRLHDAGGNRAKAVRTYHACAGALERELGIEPSPATRRVYEALLPREAEPVEPVPRRDSRPGPALVGRAAERARLVDLWRDAERGRSRLVLISGEAGIGKSRLIEELRLWCAHQGAATAWARSYQAEGEIAFGPVVAWLQAEPLSARLGGLDPARRAQLARLMPELRLAGAPSEALEGAPGDQRRQLFEALAAAIAPAGTPVLLVADDVQWADRETLQFLHYLLRGEQGAGVLLLAASRPEDLDSGHPLHHLLAGLRALERVVELELGRLSRAETALLVQGLTARTVETDELDRLYGGTEGNPLFVVEAVRAGLSGDGFEAGRITPRVQSVIESRLARLSEPARDLTGLAATIGRDFSADLLAEATSLGQETFTRALDELWRRQIIRNRSAGGYDFSHDSIREVAHRALSPALRRRHHARLAQMLEQQASQDTTRLSARIAAHHDAAGEAGTAISWYALAAQDAQRVSAHLDAIRLLERAIALTATMADERERAGGEYGLRLASLAPIAVAHGFDSDRLAEAQRRALELSSGLGIGPDAPLLRSMAVLHLTRGDFTVAHQLGEQLHRRGASDHDAVLLAEADYVLGISDFWQGDLRGARAHFEAVVAGYRSEHQQTHLAWYGLDPKTVCLSRLANTLWLLGDERGATRARDQALDLAARSAHPPTRGTVLVFAALLALDMGDLDALRRHLAAMAEPEAGQPARVNRVAAEAVGGLVDVLDGREEQGLARLGGAAGEAARAALAPGSRSLIARLLVEACASLGEARRGLEVVDAELAAPRRVPLLEPEFRRLRARFLGATGAPAGEVAREMAAAERIARRQGRRAPVGNAARNASGTPAADAAPTRPVRARRQR